MSLPPPARSLLDRVAAARPAVREDALGWLEETAAGLAAGQAPATTAAAAFVGASRRIGRAPLGPALPVAAPEGPVPTEGWAADDAARAVVLLAAAAGAPDQLAGLVDELYREGDSREKRAVIRALPLLPDAGRFVELALDAGRTNETDLFAVLACDNPYPARHYPEAAWNKLVMKAAFVGAPLDRVIGLERRANPELCRMALDYVDQQESAGRSFPPELWLVIGPSATPAALGRMIGYLNHSVAEVRRGAAAGLGRSRSRRARPWLVDRAAIEADPAVRAAITRALEESEIEVSA